VDSTEATAQVFPRPRSSRDDGAGLRRALKLARAHLGMEIAWISEFQGDEYVIRSLSGDAAALNLALEQTLPLAGSFCVRVLAGTLPSVVGEARRHPVTRELAITQEYGIGSYAGVPLIGPAGQPVGMLCCLSRSANPALDAQSLRFLQLIGELISDHLGSSGGFARTASAEEARVRAVLDGGRIRMVFQPVKRLEDGALVGYEALARFDDPDFPSPAHAFAAAARAGVGVELETLAVQQALLQLPGIPEELWLGVNLSAEALIEPAVEEMLLRAALGHRVGVEITEHTEVHDYTELSAVTERLRAAGLQIAVDDAGAGYASFRHILKLRPTVIKLDLEIVRDVDGDPVRQALTRSLVSFAAEAEAVLVAEGIETEAELRTLRELGVGYGQGFLLARPGPLPPR
jgi:EAL domain-containing protein (putative c-di-GMP-specific phosphodiesterase class I)